MVESCHLLVVEDDRSIARHLNQCLTRAGYQVTLVSDGQQAIDYLQESVPHLIVLDIMLPRASGWEVCRAVRTSPLVRQVPVLMLTSRGSEHDIVQGFALGADDFLVKPFRPRELLARVEALLRRSLRLEFASRLNGGDITLELSSRRVMRRYTGDRCEEVEVTKLEFDLLYAFLTHKNRVLSSQHLWNEVWQKPGRPELSVVRMGISRLRRKVEADPENPQHILTVRGKGFTSREE